MNPELKNQLKTNLNMYHLSRKEKKKLLKLATEVIDNCDSDTIDIDELLLELLEEEDVVKKENKWSINFFVWIIIGIISILYGLLFTAFSCSIITHLLIISLFLIIILSIMNAYKNNFIAPLLYLSTITVIAVLCWTEMNLGILIATPIMITGCVIIISAFSKNKINHPQNWINHLSLKFNDLLNSLNYFDDSYISQNNDNDVLTIINKECEYDNKFTNEKIKKLIFNTNKSNSVLDFTNFKFENDELELVLNGISSNVRIILNNETQLQNFMSNEKSHFNQTTNNKGKNTLKLFGNTKMGNVSVMVNNE